MAARTMLFNLAASAWDPALLDLFGIPAAMLPPVTGTAGRLAVTDPRVCGGRAVIGASIGDQQAALYGQRCWSAGMAKLTLGTGAFLWCHAGTAPPARVPDGVVVQLRLAAGRRSRLRAGGLRAQRRRRHDLAAPARRARRRRLAGHPGRRAARRRPARPGRGTWCVPALFGLGTPRWGAAPRADLVGLTAATTPADVAEAALLGVAYQVADAIDAVGRGIAGPLRAIRVDGGMSRNDSLLQAIADLTGTVLERPAAGEVTALGAGALAGLGTGLWDAAALEAIPFRADAVIRPALPAGDRAAVRQAWQAVLSRSLAHGSPP